MVTELCRERISSYEDNNARWRLANSVLYDMVSNHPSHTDENEIVTKMWFIGRTYAAAIERRPNKAETPGDFYYDHLAPKLIGSEIDAKNDLLRKYHAITADNLPIILSVHKYLMDLFYDLTTKEKRSLASKYLHFHLPELFFIYDSRVASVITRFAGRKDRKLNIPESVDRTYADFCYKALLMYNELNGVYSDPKTRVVDNILLRYCDENALPSNDEE
jgi:hypothetical protein